MGIIVIEIHHRVSGWPRLAATFGNGTDDLASGHLARQDADIAVLEGPIWPQGDLDGLFAGFRTTFDVVGRYVDNAKPDFWHGPSELIEGNSGTRFLLEPVSHLPGESG